MISGGLFVGLCCFGVGDRESLGIVVYSYLGATQPISTTQIIERPGVWLTK